jgi:hypothetical protein
MKNNILLAIAVAAVFSVAASVNAGDILLSPKGQDQANSLRKAPATPVSDPDLLANRPTGNAKAWALAQSIQKAPVSHNDVDLATAPRPSLRPRDPGFDAAWRANAVDAQVQVAPLK